MRNPLEGRNTSVPPPIDTLIPQRQLTGTFLIPEGFVTLLPTPPSLCCYTATVLHVFCAEHSFRLIILHFFYSRPLKLPLLCMFCLSHFRV